VEVQTVQLDGLGFVLDRRWLVTDPAGKFITQRDIPAMARIQPTLLDDAGALELGFPGFSPLRVPPPGVYDTEHTELVQVRIPAHVYTWLKNMVALCRCGGKRLPCGM
jgi:uncharacterized protein YcbX